MLCKPSLSVIRTPYRLELMLQTVESALQTVYDGLTITPAFDGLAQSILITKITVPEHHNLVFRFIDGSIYRYRMTAATPKSKPGAYERKQNHERILALYHKGTTPAEFARVLDIGIKTVNSFLRRWRNKNKS